MTATDVEMADATAAPKQLPPFPTIRLLELVTNSRQQHGLRHGDYYRYRLILLISFY